jgi:hypothetical protein
MHLFLQTVPINEILRKVSSYIDAFVGQAIKGQPELMSKVANLLATI